MPGPPPKRSNQRRRRNKPEVPIDTAPSGAAEAEIPEPEEDWHPIAVRWFESLKASGQSFYYEPSDWAVAVFLAESMSRDLKDQFLGISDLTGEVVRGTVPVNGARLNAYLKGMTALLATEGDRRRARLELQRGKPLNEGSDVGYLDELRRRRSG